MPQDNRLLTDSKVSDFGYINRKLAKFLEDKMNFKNITKIQKSTFAALETPKDALIRSETGSGKTLAFCVPIVNDLLSAKFSRKQGTKVLIISPTRELSLQTYKVLRQILSIFPWIVPGTLMGGEKKKSEKARIRKGISVLVATPGRCLDHLENTESFNIKNLSWLVLDEADRLLDLGFEEKIRKILKIVERSADKDNKRKHVLVSATLPPSVQNIADTALKNPVFVLDDKNNMDAKIENFDYFEQEIKIESFQIPANISQKWVEVLPQQRLSALIALLSTYRRDEEERKVITFASTCSEIHFLYSFFSQLYNFFNLTHKSPIPIFQLHGEMSQKDRTSIFFKFCECKNGFLFCTDIAARGLDLPFVDLIVQYDAPISPVEYIHRIGRTARFNSKGNSILFLMPVEVDYIQFLNKQKQKIQKIDSEKFFNDLSLALHKNNKKTAKRILRDNLIEKFLSTKIFSIVNSDEELKNFAEKAFDHFLKSYATYPKKLKHIFHPKRLETKQIAKSFGIGSIKGKRKYGGNKIMKQQKKIFKKEFRNKVQKTDFEKMAVLKIGDSIRSEFSSK